jgi:D-xylose transport system permease protein
MSITTTSEAAAPATQLDRSDVRVKHAEGFGGAVSAFVDRIRSGDLGALPVIVGLIVIWTVFTSLNPIFLSADNLVNLLFDCSTTGVIALGIVCVLMLGQIDLSVGSMSGFASALVGMLWVNLNWPLPAAIVVALGVGGAIGVLYAWLFNRLGMPSFVATLSGLLAILGLQLYVLGSSGSINLPYGSTMVDFGQMMVLPARVSHAIAVVPGIVILIVGLRTRTRRQAVNLSAPSVASVVVRVVVITVLLEVVVAYLNHGRGVPLMFGLFLALAVAMDYALRRTRWGRSMNAVGGNREAARRAGINVNMIFTSAFVLCASLAALGGVLTAARLASASQQAGTGDVNLNAIAAAVIGGMITGAVLAIAVIVDSLARQSRVSHGRA